MGTLVDRVSLLVVRASLIVRVSLIVVRNELKIFTFSKGFPVHFSFFVFNFSLLVFRGVKQIIACFRKAFGAMVFVVGVINLFFGHFREAFGVFRKVSADFRKDFGGLNNTFGVFRKTFGATRNIFGDLNKTFAGFRKNIRDFRKTMAMFRKTVAIYRKTMAMFRKTMADFRETVVHIPEILPDFLNNYLCFLKKEKMCKVNLQGSSFRFAAFGTTNILFYMGFAGAAMLPRQTPTILKSEIVSFRSVADGEESLYYA